MTEREFIEEICREPDDDAARLIFSDWLEENGNPDRAEFIRLQVARANDETGDLSRPELLERERELFQRHQEEWLQGLPQLPGVVWGNGWPSRPAIERHHFRRGFLFHADVKDVDSMRRHAHAICRHTAVRSLTFQFPSSGNRIQDTMQELRNLAECHDVSAFSHLRIQPSANIRIGVEGVRVLTECRRLGRLKALHLDHQALGDEGARLLAASPRFSELTELGLAANGLTSQSLISLAQSPHLARLRHLDFSFVYMDDPVLNQFDAAGMLALGASNRWQQLHTLRLSENGLDDSAATALGRAVLPGLRFLDLSFNKISANGLRQLACSQLLCGLREFSIGDNPLGTAGAMALIKTAPLAHLHTLDLSGTGLGTEAVFVLGGSALGQRLGHLNLSGNPIGVEGMRFFLERRFWPNLQRLALSYLPHERDVAESLKECWGPRADLSFRPRE